MRWVVGAAACRSVAETGHPFGDGELFADVFGWSQPTVFKTVGCLGALRLHP